MARELKPCGTEAAYRRHLRKGEKPCAKCTEFIRRRSKGRREAEKITLGDIPVQPVDGEVDPLTEALDSLNIIRAALHSGDVPMNTIASLTKRRDELVDRIKELNADSVGQEVSVVDELTNRRRRRAEATG